MKQFKANVSNSLVKHEASVLAKMDHPGNDQNLLFKGYITLFIGQITYTDLGGGCRGSQQSYSTILYW